MYIWATSFHKFWPVHMLLSQFKFADKFCIMQIILISLCRQIHYFQCAELCIEKTDLDTAVRRVNSSNTSPPLALPMLTCMCWLWTQNFVHTQIQAVMFVSMEMYTCLAWCTERARDAALAEEKPIKITDFVTTGQPKKVWSHWMSAMLCSSRPLCDLCVTRVTKEEERALHVTSSFALQHWLNHRRANNNTLARKYSQPRDKKNILSPPL